MNNGYKDEKDVEGDDEELNAEETKSSGGVAARLNYLSLDCPDLQFQVKEGSREMASPKRGSWKVLKRLARYLVGREAVVWRFKWQDETRRSEVATNSDWGGN